MRTVDITPTWTGVLPVLLAALQDGTPKGKAMAIDELRNMALAADEWNKHCKRVKADGE